MTNPGAQVKYDPNNPFNVGVPGTGNFTVNTPAVISPAIPKIGDGTDPNFTVNPQDAARMGLNTMKPVAPAMPTTQGVQQPAPVMNITTGNPALKSLFDNTNTLLQDFTAKGGVISPEMQKRISDINNTESQKLSSIAGARTSADSKDALGLGTNIDNTNNAEISQQAGLQSLLDELKTARENYIGSLAITQGEQDLSTRLNTLRTERQLLPLELRNEGISAPGIAGRQVNDERVRAIQEQNLLLELGLKQDARKMAGLAAEKQVDFINSDIELKGKIEQQLIDNENELVKQARELRKDSLSALSDIVDSFTGLAFTDLDPQTQADILETAKQFDIPPSLLADAMKAAKQQQVFDNSLKLAQEARLSEKGSASPADIKAENYDQAKQEAIGLFQADAQRNADGKISPDLYLAVRDKMPSTLKDDFDRWARDAGYLSDETMERFGILAKSTSEFANPFE